MKNKSLRDSFLVNWNYMERALPPLNRIILATGQHELKTRLKTCIKKQGDAYQYFKDRKAIECEVECNQILCICDCDICFNETSHSPKYKFIGLYALESLDFNNNIYREVNFDRENWEIDYFQDENYRSPKIKNITKWILLDDFFDTYQDPLLSSLQKIADKIGNLYLSCNN